MPSWLRRAAGAGVAIALIVFYVIAATEHGRRVNVSKARGDQSGYLGDAENVYANWHGRQPQAIIGERNRMPVYAGYLALFYHRGLSDPDFFEVGKRANILLSVGALLVLAFIFARHLPGLQAANLTGVVAFGYFIFKAGYTQSETLFYVLLFLTFLGCWHLLRQNDGWRLLALSAATGAAAGLSYLTKAAVSPFVALFLTVFLAEPIVAAVRRTASPTPAPARASLRWRLTAAILFVVAFLAVLSPYLATNKRVFGRYFYNVNSLFYVWYDNWAQASVGTLLHKDGVGWPDMPQSELPGPLRYWREHRVTDIAARFGDGFANMAIVSYTTYNYLTYLLLYAGIFALLAGTRGRVIGQMIQDHAWTAIFLLVYAGVYLLAIAFYFPVSGTGTSRFLLAHFLPLFFVLSCALSSGRLKGVHWTVAGVTLGLRHFHWLVTLILSLDVLFRLWPRLMTTYGGF